MPVANFLDSVSREYSSGVDRPVVNGFPLESSHGVSTFRYSDPAEAVAITGWCTRCRGRQDRPWAGRNLCCGPLARVSLRRKHTQV
ncbi:MAG: hypothetical protein JWO10_355 [Microbacteriaceae bacterium]|nr:hypothetical protein [Microbacteriaceae bacterium]